MRERVTLFNFPAVVTEIRRDNLLDFLSGHLSECRSSPVAGSALPLNEPVQNQSLSGRSPPRSGSCAKVTFHGGHRRRTHHSKMFDLFHCLYGSFFPPLLPSTPPPFSPDPDLLAAPDQAPGAFLISNAHQIFNPAPRHHSDWPNTGVQSRALRLRSNSGGSGRWRRWRRSSLPQKWGVDGEALQVTH